MARASRQCVGCLCNQACVGVCCHGCIARLEMPSVQFMLLAWRRHNMTSLQSCGGVWERDPLRIRPPARPTHPIITQPAHPCTHTFTCRPFAHQPTCPSSVHPFTQLQALVYALIQTHTTATNPTQVTLPMARAMRFWCCSAD